MDSRILLYVVLVAALAMSITSLFIALRIRRWINASETRVMTRLNKLDLALFRQIEHYTILDRELGLGRWLPSLRGWAASPDVLVALVGHVMASRPKVILECGAGASTIVLAKCLEIIGGGHVWSLEHDPEYADQQRKRLDEAELGDWVTIIDAPLVDHRLRGKDWPWYETRNLPESPIELVFIDGPPGLLGRLSRFPAGVLLKEKLSSNAVLYIDDANRDDEIEMIARWLHDNPDWSSRRIDCEKGCVIIETGAGEAEDSKASASPTGA